jgi:hypothetical protein
MPDSDMHSAPPPPPPASRELFVNQLDLLLDRSLKTRACIDALAAQQAAEKARQKRVFQRWVLAKQATLAMALVLSFLQYHMLSVCVEIASLRPVAAAPFATRTLRGSASDHSAHLQYVTTGRAKSAASEYFSNRSLSRSC